MNTRALTTQSISDLIQALRAHVGHDAALVLDSRNVMAGDVFLACPGLSVDGRNYIQDAVARGAAAVVYEGRLSEAQRADLGNVLGCSVSGLRAYLGELAHQWWNRPSETVKVIAVTGTNGKTTTAQWIGAALRSAGHPSAVIGTLGVTNVQGELTLGTTLTTPDVVSLQHQLARLRDQGAQFVVLEASSIGLEQGRMDAVAVYTAIFTNLSQDHLDYHPDMQAYAQAKSLLFSMPSLKHIVINQDDPSAGTMIRQSTAPITRYGIRSDVQRQWCAQDVKDVDDGMTFLLSDGQQSARVHTHFIGLHNVSNLLAVAATLGCLGWSHRIIADALARLPAVAGRMEPVVWERVGLDKPLVFVDYAHTPDALENVLRSVRGLADIRGGDVWCIAGCGGDRDASKRAPMGAVLSQLADQFIVTSDNPRREDPQSIIDQVWQGVVKPTQGQQEQSREVAILRAIWQAAPRDVVVIAGKGHETYQQTGSVKRQFDDREWAKLALLYYGKGQWEQVPEIAIDSRRVRASSMFVAIKGERFDAHQFLADVAHAKVALVSSPDVSINLSQIVVDDTRQALQAMAKAWRRRFELPVIAVTGSNGKTTTKEMLAAIVRAWVGEQHSLSTQGNLNNDLGVPLTLLRLRPWHKAAVIELGMNHPGEIAQLADWAAPSVGLVLNAQREHQEFMCSVEAVAIENGQVLQALPENGVAVFMAQPEYRDLWTEMSAHALRRWQFGLEAPAEVYVRELRVGSYQSEFTLCTPRGERPVCLPVPGVHNVLNALASAACALAAGAHLDDVILALEQFKAVKGRMQLHHLDGERILIDDTYNANPDSVRTAIDVLQTLNSPRVLVLGDMGETGDQGPQMHREIGLYAKEHQIENLWTLGDATLESVKSFGDGAKAFTSAQALIDHTVTSAPTSMLVKGSRFMAMERVVDAILEKSASNHNQENGEQHHVG